jgi:peptidoglycan-associated lipoprotein
VISRTVSWPRSFDAQVDAVDGAAPAPERRGKETNVKKTCNTRLWAAFAVAALMAAGGCQSTGTTTQTTTQTVPAPAGDEVAAVESQPELQTVYFDYDCWGLRDEARRALRGNAQHLQTNPGWGVVTVAGHCDERGSDEYNVALGERRAEAVKRYLVDLGIPSSRIRAVSFGESRPAMRGDGDAAWSRNRRAEMSLGTQQASR